MMLDAQITTTLMKDGSRHFLSLPESCSSNTLKTHLERIPGIRVCDTMQGGFQWWMSFQCLGWRFSINNPFGEFWFFVEDANCPEEILRCLTRRLSASLRS